VVRWSDQTDAILAGDLTAGVGYGTPAGGAVITPVAPIGLRDRQRGELTFTTSLGFGRKLERLRRDPKVALAYHGREHGFAHDPLYVLAQGEARIVEHPDPEYLERIVRPASTRHLGAPKEGRFWDRWLREYYEDRVPVHVSLARVVTWPDLRCAGPPAVEGAPWPEPPASQAPPRGGTGPRLDAGKAARALGGTDHQLLAFRGADGHPMIVPVEIAQATEEGIELRAADGLIPAGERRAGLLGHSYHPQLVGLTVRQHTGWLSVADSGRALYAPHTETGFRAPTNKTLLLLANGFMAKRGLRRARRGA